MINQDTIVLLKQVPLFSRLKDRELKAILKSATDKEFKAGTKIVSEGDAGVGFYLIISGGADVRRGEERLARLGKGSFFGEMSLLDDAPRSADVIATEDTRCFVLTPWAMKGLIAAHPEVALGMLAELARRLRETDRALS